MKGEICSWTFVWIEISRPQLRKSPAGKSEVAVAMRSLLWSVAFGLFFKSMEGCQSPLDARLTVPKMTMRMVLR